MKTRLGLLLAVSLAVSAPAFAGDTATPSQRPTAEATQDATPLDYRPTGSVQRAVQAEVSHGHAGTQGVSPGRKLGIDVNPWMMPTF
jgi:hypothetical protein